MDQDWKIERWREEYVYTHIRVAHLLFRSIDFSHHHHVAQVAFQANVVPVVVVVHLCLGASSVCVDSLLCHFGKEARHPFDFDECLPGVFLSQLLPCHDGGTQHPASCLPDFGARFCNQLLRFLCCGARKPSYEHFGHIQGKTHVGLFKLYPTSLSWHSRWHVENLQEISCCFKSVIRPLPQPYATP